uniref:calponin homology domain-containing protein DDB_G0272472-like n=1 Tax=Myxine glutinosa TaxID=7769 RepID=UPI00358E995F
MAERNLSSPKLKDTRFKYSALSLSTSYKGQSLEIPRASVVTRQGLQTLGKVATSRRTPLPLNLPSLRAEGKGSGRRVAAAKVASVPAEGRKDESPTPDKPSCHGVETTKDLGAHPQEHPSALQPSNSQEKAVTSSSGVPDAVAKEENVEKSKEGEKVLSSAVPWALSVSSMAQRPTLSAQVFPPLGVGPPTGDAPAARLNHNTQHPEWRAGRNWPGSGWDMAPPILDLQQMKELDTLESELDGGWAGAQEEVDYEEQLHFSDGDDDEGKGTSNRGRTGREVWGDGQSEIQRSRTAQSVPNQALPHRALPHHTLHPPRQGLPPPRQGLPPPRQGLPTPRQGLPPPRQGLPPSRQTLPLPLPQQDPPQSHPAQPCQDPPHQGLLNQAPSPDNSAHIKPIEPPLSQGLMQNLVPNQIPNDDLATSPQISSDPCLVAPLLPVPPLDSPSDVSLPPPPGASDSAWRFRTRCVDAAVERARHRREVEEKEREEVTRRACQLKLKRLEDRERERRSELGTQSEMESVPETPKVTIIERNNGSLKESEKMNSKELELVPDEQVVLESENRELNEEKAVECERDFGFEADVVKQDEHSANVCEIIQSTEIQQLMVEETRWEKVECGQQKELGAEVKTVEDDKIDLLDERQNVQEREREREEIKKPEREKVLGVDWRMGVRVNELENEQGMDEIRLTGNMESVRSMNEWQHGVCEKHEIGRDVWKEIESKNLGKARERCWDGNKGIERVTGTGKGEEREKFVQESKEETKGVQERLRDGEEDLWRKKVHVEGDTDRVNEGEIMKVESWRKREVVETDLVRERKAERGDRGRVRMGEFIRDGDNDRRQVWRERTREVDWEKKAVLDNEQRRGKEYIRKGCEPNGVVSEAKDRDNVWNERFHDVKRLKKEGSKGNEAGIETDAAGHRDRCGVVGEEIRELKDINSIEAMQNHGFGKNEREVKTVRNLEKWNEKMRKGQVIKDGEEDEMSEGKINREEFPRGMKGDGQREKGTEERKGIMETEVKTQSQLSTEIIDEKEGNDKMYGFQQQPSSTLIPQKQHQRAISKPTQYQHSFDAFHSAGMQMAVQVVTPLDTECFPCGR